MNGSLLQLLVLAGIAIFLVVKLRGVLGTREGFEKPQVARPEPTRRMGKNDFEVIEGGPDLDITDHVAENSDAATAFAAMKRADPTFSVAEFIQGARGAYEMILMAFERGDLASIKTFVSDDIYDAFEAVVMEREAKGLTIEANFIGVSDVLVRDAEFNDVTKEAEITTRFTGEMTWQLRDRGGDVIEGDANAIKRQKDVWTFARDMGADDPNWRLVATGE